MRILQPQGGDASQQGDVSEAESRLLTLCRRFVADAAEDAWARHQAALATGASEIHTWDEVRSIKVSEGYCQLPAVIVSAMVWGGWPARIQKHQ